MIYHIIMYNSWCRYIFPIFVGHIRYIYTLYVKSPSRIIYNSWILNWYEINFPRFSEYLRRAAPHAGCFCWMVEVFYFNICQERFTIDGLWSALQNYERIDLDALGRSNAKAVPGSPSPALGSNRGKKCLDTLSSRDYGRPS